MSYDAGDKEHVGERKVLARAAADSRLNGLKRLMADKDGRAWLYQFLAQSPPFASAFHQDPYVTAYNCGAKLMPVQITDQLLTHCPAEYALMLKESKELPEVKKEKQDD